MSRGVFDLFSHVVVAVEIKDVRYEVKCILIVLYIRIETGQVEAIGEVVFINLAEVFVATRRDELFKLVGVRYQHRSNDERKVHLARKGFRVREF